MTEAQKSALVDMLDLEFQGGEFHHGDCVGADAEAHDLALAGSWIIVIHPPDVDAKRAFKVSSRSMRPKPYLTRNHDIVDSTEVLIACPNGVEQLRSGTWATIRYASNKRKPIRIIHPDGVTTNF